MIHLSPQHPCSQQIGRWAPNRLVNKNLQTITRMNVIKPENGPRDQRGTAVGCNMRLRPILGLEPLALLNNHPLRGPPFNLTKSQNRSRPVRVREFEFCLVSTNCVHQLGKEIKVTAWACSYVIAKSFSVALPAHELEGRTGLNKYEPYV